MLRPPGATNASQQSPVFDRVWKSALRQLRRLTTPEKVIDSSLSSGETPNQYLQDILLNSPDPQYSGLLDNAARESGQPINDKQRHEMIDRISESFFGCSIPGYEPYQPPAGETAQDYYSDAANYLAAGGHPSM